MTAAKAHDIMSMFQLYSVVAIALREKSIKKIEVFLVPNSRGRYCFHECDIIIHELFVSIKYQESNGAGGRYFFSIIIKFFIFALRRILPTRGPRVVIIHHTYIKPSHFCQMHLSDVIFCDGIVFEEGTGTYASLRHHQDVGKDWHYNFPTLKFICRRVLSLFAVKHFSVLFRPRMEDIESFKSAVRLLQTKSSSLPLNCLKNVVKKNSGDRLAILFTSVELDIGLVSLFDFHKYVESIILKFNSYNILVKPHPLEERSLKFYSQLGLTVINPHVSAEEIFMALSPVCVIGGYSGSLLTARNIFNIPFFLVPCPSVRSICPSVKQIFLADNCEEGLNKSG